MIINLGNLTITTDGLISYGIVNRKKELDLVFIYTNTHVTYQSEDSFELKKRIDELFKEKIEYNEYREIIL